METGKERAWTKDGIHQAPESEFSEGQGCKRCQHCSDIREDAGLEEAFCALMLSVTLSRRGSIVWWVQNLN